MIEITRIYVSISLVLITATLILHLLAMGNDRWKIYENRTMLNKKIFIGIFRRCENHPTNISINMTFYSSKLYPICDYNKYYFHDNSNCLKSTANQPDPNVPDNTQYLCNFDNSLYNCDYSSITKGLISCSIIAACTLGLSSLLIFSHILVNQFKYKIHMYISIITLPLLFLGFIFILITLILFGSTMSYDLYQYRYNLNNRLACLNVSTYFRENIMDKAYREYDIRLDWAAGLEIGAVILSSFTLAIQIVYLISIYRNRVG